MTIPSVNLNGTGKAELLTQLGDAYIAVHAAIGAMARATPHGRDYYLQDGGQINGPVYQTARDEHFARVAKLEYVKDELMELRQGIASQGRR